MYATTDAKSADQIESVYKAFYAGKPFVKLAPQTETPTTKFVMGTNDCRIGFRLFPEKKRLVVFSAIDNIVKGASGQAIQCMNIMCGFAEDDGLKQIGMYL